LVTKTKTHFPQVPLEIVKKIVEEENGEYLDEETPELLRGPAKDGTNGEVSVEVRPKNGKREVL
jgi:hypothetical protein